MSDLPSFYFQTRFCPSAPVLQLPKTFAIITAGPTTGEVWSEEEIQIQAQRLKRVLKQRDVWYVELTGYSPTDEHAEPGWAVELNFDEACTLGLCFRQHAIYWVVDDELFVSLCGSARVCVPVGSFREQLDRGPEWNALSGAKPI